MTDLQEDKKRKRRFCPIDFWGSGGFSDVRKIFRETAMLWKDPKIRREREGDAIYGPGFVGRINYSSLMFGQSAVVEGAEGPDRAREPGAGSARGRRGPQISDLRAAIDAVAPGAARDCSRS